MSLRMIFAELETRQNQIFVTILSALAIVVTFLLSRTSSKPQAATKLKSYRIREIPRTITEKAFRAELKECLGDAQGELQGRKHDPLRLTLNLRYPVDTKFIGVTPLFESDNALVDIIAVPGLGSHAMGVFKEKGGNNIWLRDFLPEDVPKSRVLVYGYNTSITEKDTKYSIQSLAKAFLDSVRAFRAATETTRRPMVFIGHSLGGLLIKEALSFAFQYKDELPNDDYFKSSHGLVFFGVPNLGLKKGKLEEITKGQLNAGLIKDLAVDNESEPSPYLELLKKSFIDVCRKQIPPFKIISYYEQKMSATTEKMPDGLLSKSGPPCLMVTKESACRVGYTDNNSQEQPLDTDHYDLVRFSSRSDDEYLRVSESIKDLVKLAPSIVQSRFSLIEELSNEEKRRWDDLNDPDYRAFKAAGKVANPENGTLRWLVEKVESDPQEDSERLQMQDFVTWRDSDESGPLLVTAAPGQGKSVLSNFVLDHLEGRQAFHDCRVIYYFCNIKNEENSRTASSILRALIVQLCKDRRLFQKLPNSIQDSGGRRDFLSASFDRLYGTFCDLILSKICRRIYCIVDGLDVYPQEQMVELLKGLQRLLTVTHEGEGSVLKLFCTSRPIAAILDIKYSPRKILRASSEDLKRFVDAHLEDFPADFDEATKTNIRAKVMGRTGSTFLWISIVMGQLKGSTWVSNKAINEKIDSSSEDLDKLYVSLVKEVFKGDPRNAVILAWITFAKVPLSLEELEVAVAVGLNLHSKCWQDCLGVKVSLNRDRLQGNLGTLIEIIGDTPFLIHQSLRDFLLRSDLWRIPKVTADLKSPELLLADVCITYLSFEELQTYRYPPEGHLQYYAANFWYSHIHNAHEALEYSAKLEIIFQDPIRNSWIRSGFDHSCIERSHSPLCGIAITYDISWLANILLSKMSGKLCGVFEDDCLVQAIERSPHVLEDLLNHAETKRFEVTQEVVKAAARDHSGKHTMSLLLDHRGEDVHITEEVVKAAAGNWERGKEIMSLLLDRRGADVQITNKVVKAAAGNWRMGEEIMSLLLNHRGEDVQITKEIVKVAAGNTNSGEAIISLLLDRRGKDVQITEEVVKAAVGNERGAKKIMTLLFDRRGADVQITNEVIKAAAGNGRIGEEIMSFLLDQRGDDFQITEEVVKAAAGNIHAGEAIISLLLDQRGDDFQITEEVVKAAAGNIYTGEAIISLLLDQRGKDVPITEEALEAIARNGWSLLERLGADVQVPKQSPNCDALHQ